jgi:hypothetical protein
MARSTLETRGDRNSCMDATKQPTMIAKDIWACLKQSSYQEVFALPMQPKPPNVVPSLAGGSFRTG